MESSRLGVYRNIKSQNRFLKGVYPTDCSVTFSFRNEFHSFRTILDRVLGARAAGVHYRLISVWTLVPAGKTGRKKRKEGEREKESSKRRGLVVLGSGEENPRVLFRDADQESKTRMRNNALRTGPRQAVE
ncbi:hypothetical protein TNCV_1129551 [Trichonephila clavipes]|nr:hypothetical protein TNCV_1129551 [Trichonephila clavipes]